MQFLKYPKQVWNLSLCAMFVMGGFSFLWPLTIIYATLVLHQSVSTAGIIMSAEAAAGIAGSILGGIFFDRIGGKKTIILALITVTISSFVLIEAHNWQMFVLSFIVLAMFIGVILTCISAIAGHIWPEGGKKAFNFNYIFQNIGVALGTALGGVVSSHSFQLSFFIMALIFISALLIFLGLRMNDHQKIQKDKEDTIHVNRSVRNDLKIVTLVFLGLGSAFVMISYIQWQTTVPILMSDLGISTMMYGFLWTLNGVLVLALQPINIVIQKRLSSLKLQFSFGMCMFLLAFLLLLLHKSYLFFVAGMLALTLGEIVILPSIPAYAFQIAPFGRKGVYQGIMNVFNYCGRLFGPVIGTSLYQKWGATPMLLVMLLFLVMAFGAFLFSLKLFNRVTHHRIEVPSCLVTAEK